MKKEDIIKMLIVLLIICAIIIIATVIILTKLDNYEDIDVKEDSPQLTIDNEIYKLRGESVLFAIEEIAENNIENANEFFAEDVYCRDIEFDVQTQLYIYGTAWKKDYAEKEQVYIIITLDYDKMLYNFKLEKVNITKQEYDSIIEKIRTEPISDEKIEYNENNVFNLKSIVDQDMAIRYMEYYKVLALYNPEKAYEILNEEYKQKRFGNLQSYIQYTKMYRNTLEMLTLEKYAQKTYTEYKQYIIEDSTENYYMINAKDLFSIEMQLDNYTIELDEYTKKYESLTDQQKVKVSLTKVIKMINTKDYQNLYNLMDEKFKANNFKTIESFKNYIEKKYFYYNIIDTTDMEQNGNAYVCEIQLLNNASSAAESINNNIIIQLGEGTDFKIAFAI